MPITEKQRLARVKKLGSSDAPAILGVSPWQTATDVYWSKCTPITEADPTQAMRTGNRLEGALIEFAQEELAAPIKRNQYRVSHELDEGMLAANLDGIVVGKSEGVECKYVGQSMADQWGDPGTDEVPDHVIVQVQHAMYCAELERMWVAAAVARYSLEWRLYCVRRHEPLVRLIVEREMAFWENHILTGIPPAPGPPPLEVLVILRREPGSLTFLDDEYLEAVKTYEELAAARRFIDQRVEKAKQELLALLDEAEAGKFSDGTLVTFLSQRSPARCDLANFRAECPALYDKYVTQGTHRVLRIKRLKEALTHGDRNTPKPIECADANARPPAAIEGPHRLSPPTDGGTAGDAV